MNEAPDARLAAAVESLLFAAPEPLPVTRIAEILEVPAEDAVAALSWLTNGAYRDRGMQVLKVAGGYQMVTNPDFAPYVGRLLAPPPPRLSRAAMETLSIIAYRQPVTLPEIEAIRGVDASGVVRTLSERGMVRDVGKKDTVGHPTLYATTPLFLRHFGLDSVDELPPLPSDNEDEECGQLGLAIESVEAPEAEGGAEAPTEDVE
ncbi:MAG TPA: SMC-Scp complex subunit ScpB [Armatimonadota bacterium]|jgi:segregation and condensation protein B